MWRCRLVRLGTRHRRVEVTPTPLMLRAAVAPRAPHVAGDRRRVHLGGAEPQAWYPISRSSFQGPHGARLTGLPASSTTAQDLLKASNGFGTGGLFRGLYGDPRAECAHLWKTQSARSQGQTRCRLLTLEPLGTRPIPERSTTRSCSGGRSCPGSGPCRLPRSWRRPGARRRPRPTTGAGSGRRTFRLGWRWVSLSASR